LTADIYLLYDISSGVVDVMADERHQIFSQPAHVKSEDDNECNFLGRHEVSMF